MDVDLKENDTVLDNPIYLSEKETQEKPTVNLKAIGKSGTLVTANYVDDEYLPELKGVKKHEEFEKMLRSDSQIRKLYHAVSLPIKSATWNIEPASTEEIDIKVAALIKHILFNDLPDGFKDKLDEIMTFPWHGHAIFEVVHKNATDKIHGPYTGLKSLGFRAQDTITKWEYVDDALSQIYQEQSGDLAVNTWIPANTLLIFYNEKKGNDNGFPFLRMVYGNYKRKLLYKQLQAIGIERGALQVPMLKVPEGTNPESEQWALAEDQLRQFSLAESSYFMFPAGFELTLSNTNTFDPSKVQSAIKAENEEIAGSMVAMFLEMGIGGNSGNQAGTEVSAEFFRDGIIYLADKIKDVFNIKLIPQLVRLNFGDVVTEMPKLVHAGITEKAGKELMEIVTGYKNAGVITVDEPLEDWVRKQHNLPVKAAGEMLENKDTTDDNTPDDTPDTEEVDDEVELNEGGNSPVVKIMNKQAEKISDAIRSAVRFSGQKFIADTMNRYRQLSADKKQSATSKVSIGGQGKFKSSLKSLFAETANNAINSALKEVGKSKEIKLNSSEFDMNRMRETYGDLSEIKLNELSKFPTHIQILITKQAELITEQTLQELQSKLSFAFSSIETKSNDEDVIAQNMDETLEDFAEGNTVNIKGDNVSALLVNEGRNSVFFDPEVEASIHSYTFMNDNPKSKICIELAGTTFNTNDAESLRYSPPLHHNCKSYLRANLSTSRGVNKLEIKTLSPSADGVKSITL